MLIEYYPSESYLHGLDVRTKILGFLVVSVISFIFLSPIINFLLALLTAIILFTVHTPLSRIKKLLKPLVPIFLIMLIITGFTYPASAFKNELNQKVLFSLGESNSIHFTVGGFFYGITLVLRILIMVLTSTIITFTTPIEDFLQLMKKIKIPYQFAFIITSGIRFIPTMQKKSEMIQEAQRARGAEIGKGGFIKDFKSHIIVLIPLIVDSLRMSDNLAIAMLNRSFGALKTTTDIHGIKMKTKDYLICLSELVLVAFSFWIRSNNIGVL